ncbi:MAG TPA: hypothetical protein V6C97_27610 [Oculatellaceae cyanobacterium]
MTKAHHVHANLCPHSGTVIPSTIHYDGCFDTLIDLSKHWILTKDAIIIINTNPDRIRELCEMELLDLNSQHPIVLTLYDNGGITIHDHYQNINEDQQPSAKARRSNEKANARGRDGKRRGKRKGLPTPNGKGT